VQDIYDKLAQLQSPLAQISSQIVSLQAKGAAQTTQVRTEGSGAGTSSSSTSISSAPATVIEDTHANRLAHYPATTYAVGTLFFETDREVMYSVNLVGGVNAWVYMLGIMTNVFANRPTDLGTNDVNFLFLATDVGTLYQWTGSAWATLSLVPLTTLGDTLYENATPAPTRLPGNTTTTPKTLVQTGTGTISAAPAWVDPTTLWGTGPTVQAVANPWIGTPTGSRALGTVYKNPSTVKSLKVCVSLVVAFGQQVNALTDSASTPSTIVGEVTNGNAAGTITVPITFEVLPNNYYELAITSGTPIYVYWAEWQ